jgi:hypothetical protein
MTVRDWLVGVVLGLLVPGVAMGQEAATAEVHPRALRAALSHYERIEPPVGAVVAAALREGAPDLEELHSLATRARLAGLLPTLRLGAQRGSGWDLSERLDDSGRVQLGTDDSLTLRGQAVFALDRLIFAREEVPLAREARATRLVRQDLVRSVVRIYYERRRLLLERDLLGVSGIDHATRIAEATALLDAFTRGAFTRMMAERGRQTSAQTVSGGGARGARGGW